MRTTILLCALICAGCAGCAACSGDLSDETKRQIHIEAARTEWRMVDRLCGIEGRLERLEARADSLWEIGKAQCALQRTLAEYAFGLRARVDSLEARLAPRGYATSSATMSTSISYTVYATADTCAERGHELDTSNVMWLCSGPIEPRFVDGPDSAYWVTYDQGVMESMKEGWVGMKVVYSIAVPVTAGFSLTLPVGAEILTCLLMAGTPTVFYLADQLVEKYEKREFGMAYLGTPMPDKVRYIASVVIRSGGSSWHLFEITKEGKE